MTGATAAALSASPALAQTADSTTAKSTSGIEEVIVTAEKRPEAVRKISGSVSAVTGAQLEALGAQDMSDYLTRTPGVVFNAQTPGNSTVVLRGISTTTGIDQGQGTTGYFIDDVPLTDPS
jgi:outer membrane receptor protein involved in Fe transport